MTFNARCTHKALAARKRSKSRLDRARGRVDGLVVYPERLKENLGRAVNDAHRLGRPPRVLIRLAIAVGSSRIVLIDRTSLSPPLDEHPASAQSRDPTRAHA
jgi:hypothetical protein